MTNQDMINKLKEIGYYKQGREDRIVTDFILSIENDSVKEKVFKVYFDSISYSKDKSTPVAVLTLMILNTAKILFEEEK